MLLLNRAKMTVASPPGIGTITLAAAISPYETFQNAGALDLLPYSYLAEDGSDSEEGWGIYTAAGTTLTRNLLHSTTGSLLNLSGSAEISVASLAESQSIITFPRVNLATLATYTWSNLPQTFNDLELLVVGRTTHVGLNTQPLLRVNGLSTAIYTMQQHAAQNATAAAAQALLATSLTPLAALPGTTAVTGMQGFVDLCIFDYAGASGLEKSGKWHGKQPNSTSTRNHFTISGTLDIVLTAAITSIEFAITSGVFTTGSYAQLRLKR